METQNTELARPEASSLTDKVASNQDIRIAPLVDIYENTDEILVVADFPGVPRESLDIRLDGGELRIQGSRAEGQGGGSRSITFARAFRVPNTIDPNAVTAELSQGVLRLHLKKSEAAKPRRINVKSS